MERISLPIFDVSVVDFVWLFLLKSLQKCWPNLLHILAKWVTQHLQHTMHRTELWMGLVKQNVLFVDLSIFSERISAQCGR